MQDTSSRYSEPRMDGAQNILQRRSGIRRAEVKRSTPARSVWPVIEEQDGSGKFPFPFLKRAEPSNGLGERNGREFDGGVGVCERLDARHTRFVKGEWHGKIHLTFVEQFEDLVGVRLRIPEILMVDRGNVFPIPPRRIYSAQVG